ncbi:MAG: dTDP-4-dehydrorhamnose 3,5-epimerase family protein [Acidobacteria bacterium]|nr:dTDP-4-dehydrorhamnose 3,5-epimerase family protein [Acidobacteriota bacterium]MBI3655683.1 dTDP-4-dehydrorhamnose 3,5-epimerase family protein [Acidobacteriota bacterium]
MIGVEIIPLEVYEDERGSLAELLRSEHPLTKKEFGQIHVSRAHPTYTRGNHYHTRKYEWFSVVGGNGLLALENVETGEREEIPMGEKNMVTVRIPPGVAHGIKNIGDTTMYLIVYNEETFDPKDPDTFAKKVI